MTLVPPSFSSRAELLRHAEQLSRPPGMPCSHPQVGIGICTKTTAEATKRGDMFMSELDFVVANIIMALVADFCLVWLPAPRATWRCFLRLSNVLPSGPPAHSHTVQCHGLL